MYGIFGNAAWGNAQASRFGGVNPVANAPSTLRGGLSQPASAAEKRVKSSHQKADDPLQRLSINYNSSNQQANSHLRETPAVIRLNPSATLDSLKRHQRATIVSVAGGDSLAARLAEMGLQAGETIEMLGSAPWGDPRAYRVRGYRLALRSSEAQRVLIETE